MHANVDLRELAIRRNGAPPAPRPAGRRRNWLTRYVLPGVVLLGFVGVLTWAARDSFLPSQPVTVVPVLSTRSEVQNEGSPLFQAAGWVEPRPTATVVTALAEGVVEKLFVVEGQKVKAGEPVARLIDADHRLALDSAEADLRLRKAELASAQATLKAARINLEQPVHLQAALAEAEGTLAQKETDLSALPFLMNAARAKVELARYTYDGKKSAGSALPQVQIQQAKSEVDSTEAAEAELANRQVRLKREIESLKARRDALRQRLTLKTEETRAVEEAEANIQSAEARCQQAQVALNTATLRLHRMTVLAPVDGQVLSLVARPGMKVMGLAPGALQDSSTVITMYDPERLQVRADVRLEDVPRVLVGQKVKIETAAAKGSLDGEVILVTSQADIQKNTLQVKVAVVAPPTTVRPDMLVQVTFLAPPTPRSDKAENQTLRLLIPRQVVENGEGGARVWLADLGNKAARSRPVKLGQATGDLVEVVEGLTLGDRIISTGKDGLRDGQRIQVTGEEAGMPTLPGQGARPNRGETSKNQGTPSKK